MFRLPLVRAFFRVPPPPPAPASSLLTRRIPSHSRSVSPSIRSLSWRTGTARPSSLQPPLRAFRPPSRPFSNSPHSKAWRSNNYRRFDTNNGSRQPLWMQLVHKSKPQHYVIIGLIGGGFYVYNLETVEITGRRRFNCIPAAWELKIGQQSYQEVLQQTRGKILPENHPITIRVKQILSQLIPHAPIEGADWKVHVINDPEQNAFVLPGGKVFVYTGILPICKDTDGTAAVLAHEIAHVVAHHTSERLSRNFITIGAIAALVLLFDISGQLSSAFMNLFFELPHSRAQETEADAMGLMMMAKACFNPEAAAEMWDRMNQAVKDAPPQFLSTHPAATNRRDALRELLHKADAIYEDSGCHTIRGFLPRFNEFNQQYTGTM
ncbi:putative peptidase [Aspergillus heteromorphus CBS 117.55]|uniref:Putative peptidase n=1 Tax=Aspergillus heteromorphus CBS 117.55 TaxID=1448321 RepID=A0A317WP53_9EURO|nr:putative peptidase [Aspergillus heteromorphus CBS 117.55]PWY87775.1 putative peptidase [Aspergillus heteromorphus CBS 117.55]